MRSGSVLLFKNLLCWCALVLLAVKRYGVSIVAELLGQSGLEAWQRCSELRAGHISSSGHAIERVASQLPIDLMVARWSDMCLCECSGTLMVASSSQLALPAHTAMPSSTNLVMVSSDPPKYQLKLVCHEFQCTATDETPLFGDSTEAYDYAVKTMCWFKPTTQNWQHSRCPKCRW